MCVYWWFTVTTQLKCELLVSGMWLRRENNQCRFTLHIITLKYKWLPSCAVWLEDLLGRKRSASGGRVWMCCAIRISRLIRQDQRSTGISFDLYKHQHGNRLHPKSTCMGRFPNTHCEQFCSSCLLASKHCDAGEVVIEFWQNRWIRLSICDFRYRLECHGPLTFPNGKSSYLKPFNSTTICRGHSTKQFDLRTCHMDELSTP